MYYSAIVQRNCEASQKVVDIAAQCDIELKHFIHGTEQAEDILEALFPEWEEVPSMPLVLAGLEIIAFGDDAWFDLYCHSLDNPHVHWEAGDSEDYL